MQSMKRSNKFDKSVSQKNFMITRAQRELNWLKSIKPRKRQSLKFNLQSAEKSSLDVSWSSRMPVCHSILCRGRYWRVSRSALEEVRRSA